MMESGVIKTDGGDSKAALVYGQMNEPPGARARVGLTGLTLAEYFRDEEGQDVLFFVDNIFRFTQAGSERSEEHTSELQSLMRISYAVFCLKKKNIKQKQIHKY